MNNKTNKFFPILEETKDGGKTWTQVAQTTGDGPEICTVIRQNGTPVVVMEGIHDLIQTGNYRLIQYVELPKIILCDLDGTLADCQHRIHLITESPKRWREFFAACSGDSPIQHMIDLVNNLREKYEIWITSGRSDECRGETIRWLKDNGVKYDELIMRKAGDYTDDGVLKPRWLENGTIPRERVAFALDDRDRVVKAWRDAGIPCLQVASGDF